MVVVDEEEKAKIRKEKAKAGTISGTEAGTAAKEKEKEERKETTRERRPVGTDKVDSRGAEKAATGTTVESRKAE